MVAACHTATDGPFSGAVCQRTHSLDHAAPHAGHLRLAPDSSACSSTEAICRALHSASNSAVGTSTASSIMIDQNGEGPVALRSEEGPPLCYPPVKKTFSPELYPKVFFFSCVLRKSPYSQTFGSPEWLRTALRQSYWSGHEGVQR